MEFNNELTDKEKIIVMRNTFLNGKKEYVPNVGDYLAENFSKIDGFDYRWNSLITSKPLLFEDVDYIRNKQFINNTILESEIEAYKRKDLRELYATFENMLICNLHYYDRIMNFCNMVFLHYIRIDDEKITNDHLDNVPYIMEMTPTQIWCCALSNTQSTKWELNYGWGENIKLLDNPNMSCIEFNWDKLYKNEIFNKFMEYNALRCNSSGFRQTFLLDKTSNRKLSQVCTKFTKTSTAISEEQLNSLIDYVKEIEVINNKLYHSLFDCLKRIFNFDEGQFAIYVFSEEFFIHSSKFSMKVSKHDGKITKDYLSNSYECFVAEPELINSVKTQIEWAKYELPVKFEYEKQIMINLLFEMIKENYKNIICIKRMNDYGILSKISFSGIFHMVYIQEEFMFNNRSIKTNKICLSKQNAAKYVINRGYVLFGSELDVFKLSMEPILTRKKIIEHYSNYCIPIIKHMFEVISLHNLSKNDIIDIVVNNTINPNKLNNSNIKYTRIKGGYDKNHKLIASALNKQNKNINNKKTYWNVID